MREVDHRIVGRSVGKLLKFADEPVPKSQEIHAVESVQCAAAAFADCCGAMDRRLVAVDDYAMHGRNHPVIVYITLVKRFAHSLFADDPPRVDGMAPSTRRETDDVVGGEIEHAIDIPSFPMGKYRDNTIMEEIFVQIGQASFRFQRLHFRLTTQCIFFYCTAQIVSCRRIAAIIADNPRLGLNAFISEPYRAASAIANSLRRRKVAFKCNERRSHGDQRLASNQRDLGAKLAGVGA